jgi:LacI family transcriptional regulator
MRSPDEVENPRKRASLPTIQDVAARAGVSPMTASRALSGTQNVSKVLREKVEKAARELGYRRNEYARALRPGQKSGLIGILVTNLSNPYYAAVLEGAEEIAAAHGRRVLIGATHEETARERELVAEFIGRQAEGLIVVPTGGENSHLKPDYLGSIPLVLASREVEGISVDTVLIDDINGASRAIDLLLREGHKRIAFLGNAVSVFTGQRRFEGYREAHERWGIEIRDELVKRNQQDVASAEQAVAELLALDDPPTAIFGANNRNTIGAVRALSAAGKLSPGTSNDSGDSGLIRLAGFDNFDLADIVSPPLVVVDHDARELGRTAAELLIDRLDGDRKDRPARTVELETYLLDFALGPDPIN